MATPASQRLRQEVDLIERFSQSYRRQFARVIDRLNRSNSASDLQCVRLCVEAVDMMLASHSQMARSLRELTDPPAGGDASGAFRKAA